jgi:hypothetical protein
MSLPKDDAARKRIKPFAGFLSYFPDAIAAVAELSFLANEKHNPGEPMHWAKGKSTEQRESLMRHLLDEAAAGPLSRDQYEAAGKRWAILHAVSTAWRAMAQLQTLADQGHDIFAVELVQHPKMTDPLYAHSRGAPSATEARMQSESPTSVSNEPLTDEEERELAATQVQQPKEPRWLEKLRIGFREYERATGAPVRRVYTSREVHDALVLELESAPGSWDYTLRFPYDDTDKPRLLELMGAKAIIRDDAPATYVYYTT